MMRIKTTNGKWWKGQIVLGYNLRTLVLLLGALLALAAVGLALWGLWLLLGFLWSGICWLAGALWAGLRWLAAGIWAIKWWILGAALLAALIWALSRIKWERKPREPKERKTPRWLWWLLGALLLLLLALLLFRSCGSDKDNEPTPAAIETSELVTPERYAQADGWLVVDAYLSEGLNIKYADYQRFSAYGFKGNLEERKQLFGSSESYRDWKNIFQFVEGKKLGDDQLAAVVRYGLWNGLAGFEKSPICTKLQNGESINPEEFAKVYTKTGKLRKFQNEAHARRYGWVLAAIFEGDLTIEDLLDCPCKSYEALPLEKMYDQKGRYTFSAELKQQLKQGTGKTTRQALGL